MYDSKMNKNFNQYTTFLLHIMAKRPLKVMFMRFLILNL
jgi:hypothetical protein